MQPHTKRPLLLLVLALVLATGASAPAGNSPRPERHIDVTGAVEVRTPPDLVVWYVKLTHRSRSLADAKKKSDEKVKSVLEAAKRLKSGEGDVETGFLQVERETDEGKVRAYAVTRDITIRQRDLKRFDEYFDSLVEGSDMEVTFRYESSLMREMVAGARIRAMKAAREKAASLAEAAGATLGKPLTIDAQTPVQVTSLAPVRLGAGEQMGGWSGKTIPASAGINTNNGIAAPALAAEADAASERFAPGDIVAVVTVNATFLLE